MSGRNNRLYSDGPKDRFGNAQKRAVKAAKWAGGFVKEFTVRDQLIVCNRCFKVIKAGDKADIFMSEEGDHTWYNHSYHSSSLSKKLKGLEPDEVTKDRQQRNQERKAARSRKGSEAHYKWEDIDYERQEEFCQKDEEQK